MLIHVFRQQLLSEVCVLQAFAGQLLNERPSRIHDLSRIGGILTIAGGLHVCLYHHPVGGIFDSDSIVATPNQPLLHAIGLLPVPLLLFLEITPFLGDVENGLAHSRGEIIRQDHASFPAILVVEARRNQMQDEARLVVFLNAVLGKECTQSGVPAIISSR
jgi:hypothetical protein